MSEVCAYDCQPAANPHTPTETTIFILGPTSTHAPFALEVPGGVPLAMFGRDSLPVRETLASSHVAGAPP
eukprot:SAG25_NODE_12388_length_280_cov_9.309392_1_plen_69_part_01